jgi:hypothetical protein
MLDKLSFKAGPLSPRKKIPKTSDSCDTCGKEKGVHNIVCLKTNK